jgi:hypothetical protein
MGQLQSNDLLRSKKFSARKTAGKQNHGHKKPNTGIPLHNRDLLICGLRATLFRAQLIQLRMGRQQLNGYGKVAGKNSYLGKIDRLFGVPVTTRNWNTIIAIARVLDDRANVEFQTAEAKKS